MGMFTNWRREFGIRRVLKQLARQRVALVLQPGNVWVIENAVTDDETTDAALKTCYMRGWVEPLENSIPKGKLTPDGRLPDRPMFQTTGPLWKVTDSGWAAINRAHEWALIGVLLAAISILVVVA
jgi:hypothetical protein